MNKEEWMRKEADIEKAEIDVHAHFRHAVKAELFPTR